MGDSVVATPAVSLHDDDEELDLYGDLDGPKPSAEKDVKEEDEVELDLYKEPQQMARKDTKDDLYSDVLNLSKAKNHGSTAAGTEVEAEAKEAPKPVESGNINDRTLYIDSLKWWTTDEIVEKALSDFGRVMHLTFLYDEANGKSKGIALAIMDSEESATKAKEASERMIDDDTTMYIEMLSASRHGITPYGLTIETENSYRDGKDGGRRGRSGRGKNQGGQSNQRKNNSNSGRKSPVSDFNPGGSTGYQHDYEGGYDAWYGQGHEGYHRDYESRGDYYDDNRDRDRGRDRERDRERERDRDREREKGYDRDRQYQDYEKDHRDNERGGRDRDREREKGRSSREDERSHKESRKDKKKRDRGHGGGGNSGNNNSGGGGGGGGGGRHKRRRK